MFKKDFGFQSNLFKNQTYAKPEHENHYSKSKAGTLNFLPDNMIFLYFSMTGSVSGPCYRIYTDSKHYSERGLSFFVIDRLTIHGSPIESPVSASFQLNPDTEYLKLRRSFVAMIY